ncbi:MAG: aspartyl-phosphate phosphatase Spo0E family protein [Tissierellia bacterium]|nr:aspartyl-phosphate phosphatase Spo0E family protein [Tissierellia bacterium]
MVEEEYRLKEVKKEIENKRINLNQLVIKGINRDELLKFSVELDNLIVKYYDIKLDRQRADS